MPTSVRLDKSTERRLQRLVSDTGRSKSDLIREAIARLDVSLDATGGPTVYERLEGYIGVGNLEPGDRARRAEEILREGLGRTKAR